MRCFVEGEKFSNKFSLQGYLEVEDDHIVLICGDSIRLLLYNMTDKIDIEEFCNLNNSIIPLKGKKRVRYRLVSQSQKHLYSA